MIVFADRSSTVLLFVNPFAIYVLCLSWLCCLVCSLQPFGHLLENGWPLGSRVYCVSCVVAPFNMVFLVRYGIDYIDS